MKEFPHEEAAMPYNPQEPSTAGTLSGPDHARQSHERELMAIDGVEGVGVGRNRIGDEAIIVYLRDQAARSRVPQTIDGYPVEIIVTGTIDALDRG